MILSNTVIPRLAGLSGVNPQELSGRIMIEGEPVLYAHAAIHYKGKTWIVSDDQDFVINQLGAPVGAIINGVLIPLDRMTDEQHATFQAKYGYKKIPVSAVTGPSDGHMGFGFHINIPHPHISLPSRQQVLKVGRIAAAGTAIYFTAGAAAGLMKLAVPVIMSKLSSGGAPDTGTVIDGGAVMTPDAGVAPPGVQTPKPAWHKWAMMGAAAALLLI